MGRDVFVGDEASAGRLGVGGRGRGCGHVGSVGGAHVGAPSSSLCGMQGCATASPPDLDEVLLPSLTPAWSATIAESMHCMRSCVRLPATRLQHAASWLWAWRHERPVGYAFHGEHHFVPLCTSHALRRTWLFRPQCMDCLRRGRIHWQGMNLKFEAMACVHASAWCWLPQPCMTP